MATNEFIGFAAAGSANVMSQADYAAAAEQTDGVQPGPASSALANKAWRQGANMAAAIGQVVADYGNNALDDGDIATLATNIAQSFSLSKKYAIIISQEKALVNNVQENIASYTFVQPGIYSVVYVAVYRAANTAGTRLVLVSNSSTGSNFNDAAVINGAPSPAGYTFIHLPMIDNITSPNTTRYLNIKQTSGSAMNAIGIIIVSRIGDA